MLQFDLLVHRDCRFAANAHVEVYGSLMPIAVGRIPRDRLPLGVTPSQLGEFPPRLDTPHSQRYRELVDHVVSRCGWKLDEFIGLRFALAYPPFPCTVVAAFPLDRRDA
jgi:hypothetical protein